MIKQLVFGCLFICADIFSQTSDGFNKVNIEAVSLVFNPNQNDTCITEFSGEANYLSKKVRKSIEFYEAAVSESYGYYHKLSEIISEKMRDKFEKKIISSSLIDTLKSSSSYRPNDLTCQITITKLNVLAVTNSFSLKHVYQIEAKVAMLNKKDKEVYGYKEIYQSNIRKVSSLVKLTNATHGTYDYSNLELLYDTIMNESIDRILSKTHLDDFTAKKEELKDFDPNAIVKESFNKTAIAQTDITKTESDTTKSEEKAPVFSQLVLKTKNKKTTQDLSEAINSVVTVQVGQSKCSGIIISDDGYILTSYAILNEDTTKTCEIIFPDGKKITAVKARINAFADILLLKVTGNYTPLVLNTINEPKITNDIYAVGSSGSNDLGASISKGIISGNRIIEKKPILQLNAKINVWQLGGGLFMPNGDLVGMLYSKLIGKNVEGIGFALTNTYIIKSLNITYE